MITLLIILLLNNILNHKDYLHKSIKNHKKNLKFQNLKEINFSISI